MESILIRLVIHCFNIIVVLMACNVCYLFKAIRYWLFMQLGIFTYGKMIFIHKERLIVSLLGVATCVLGICIVAVSPTFCWRLKHLKLFYSWSPATTEPGKVSSILWYSNLQNLLFTYWELTLVFFQEIMTLFFMCFEVSPRVLTFWVLVIRLPFRKCMLK